MTECDDVGKIGHGSIGSQGIEEKVSVQLMRMQTDLKFRVDFCGGS